MYGIEKPPCEVTLMVITMTVGVTNYFCDQHDDQAHDASVEQVLQAIGTDSEITVLGYSSKPLTLTEIK